MFQRSHLLGGVLLEGDDVAVAVVAPDAVSEDAVARTVAPSIPGNPLPSALRAMQGPLAGDT